MQIWVTKSRTQTSLVEAQGQINKGPSFPFWQLQILGHSNDQHIEWELPGGSGKEFSWECRRCKRLGFNPWVGKIPWRWKWEPTLVFLPGKSHELNRGAWQATVLRVSKSWTQLCRHTYAHTLTMYLIFWRIAQLFSRVTTTFYILSSKLWRFPFFHILTNICFFFLL